MAYAEESTDNFPAHFDGQPLNVEGTIPDKLPFEFQNGKCTYRIDAEYVHILNKSDDDDEGLTWSEPLSAYTSVRHWVIAERTQEEEKPGFLGRLFGKRPKQRSIEEGPRHAVVALAHEKEAWMSVVLYSREIDEATNDTVVEEIAAQYNDLFKFRSRD